MPDYRVRTGRLDDIPVLVRHRIDMFAALHVPIEHDAVVAAYGRWLETTLPSGVYRAWLVETAAGEVVAGGGITVVPWPPGPRSLGDRAAFVYNIYTEPAHRRRGLARIVLETIHAWCRENRVLAGALTASPEGMPLYESMGYRLTTSPMMFCVLDEAG